MPDKEKIPGISPDNDEVGGIDEMEVYDFIFPHLVGEEIDHFRKDVRSGALGVPPENKQEVLDRLDQFLREDLEELPPRELSED